MNQFTFHYSDSRFGNTTLEQTAEAAIKFAFAGLIA